MTQDPDFNVTSKEGGIHMLPDSQQKIILATLTLSLCFALPTLADDDNGPPKEHTRQVRVPGWGILSLNMDDANVVMSDTPGEAAISLGQGRSGNAVAISRGGSAIAIGGGRQHAFLMAPSYRPYNVPVPAFDGTLLPDYAAVRAEWQAWADEMVRNAYRAYGLTPPNTEQPEEGHKAEASEE